MAERGEATPGATGAAAQSAQEARQAEARERASVGKRGVKPVAGPDDVRITQEPRLYQGEYDAVAYVGDEKYQGRAPSPELAYEKLAEDIKAGGRGTAKAVGRGAREYNAIAHPAKAKE